MKIEILPSAREDLVVGFAFYEKQQIGLGSYFLDSLFADIDSLALHAGIGPSPLSHVATFRQHGGTETAVACRI